MRLFLDQDVYAATRNVLEAEGHDVLTARDAELSRAEDSQLLRVAHEEGRLLVTRDRDFGRLVFVDDAYPGVLYLRMTPTNLEWVHRELLEVLNRYDAEDLGRSFVVVEPGRHRIRRLGAPRL